MGNLSKVFEHPRKQAKIAEPFFSNIPLHTFKDLQNPSSNFLFWHTLYLLFPSNCHIFRCPLTLQGIILSTDPRFFDILIAYQLHQQAETSQIISVKIIMIKP